MSEKIEITEVSATGTPITMTRFEPARFPFLSIRNPDLTMLFTGRVAQAGDRVRLVCTHADGENLTLQLEVIED